MDQASEILLGMGNSLDYEMAWHPEAISRLAADWGINSWPAPPEHIRHERDLLCAILAYSAAGIGTERAVKSVATIQSLARRLGFRESVGGTCVRAARVLDLLGLDCTLHLSSMSAQVESLLWPGVRYLASRRTPTAYPHLIVQFTSDGQLEVGGVARTPPRANRLIFVNDPDNAELSLAPALPQTVARSTIWLISGLNAITDEDHLTVLLEQIQTLTHGMHPGSWTVYEDGGFHHQELSVRALSAMAGVCDVVGMNEDEFAHHLATSVDLNDPLSVGAALTTVARKRRIKNLMVHTAQWVAAIGPQAEQLRPALTQGVLAGAARYYNGDAMTAGDLDLLHSVPANPDGATVATGLEQAGMTAVAALDLYPPDPVTIGLGDSFVGGFLAGLHRSGVRTDSDHGISPLVATSGIEKLSLR